VINFNSKLKEAASFGQPITEYDPASRGMADFEQLAEWLLANPPRPAEQAPPADVEAEDPADLAAGPAPAGTSRVASPAPAAHSNNPALSRAAELVERARALSRRTTEIAADLLSDPTAVSEGIAADAPAAAPRPAPPQPEPEPDRPAADPALKAKLAKLFGVRATAKGVLFVQPAEQAAGQVAIAGDFNDWNPSKTPLRRDENLGVWQACIPIPPGRYRYRLVVDGKWVQDPHNPTVETNPFGELNNILEVSAELSAMSNERSA